MSEEEVRASFATQAGNCRRLGSEFTSALCALAAERLDRASSLGQEILDWAGDPDPHRDALALRFAGSLHALVRSGAAPALARLYPPHALSGPDEFWGAVSAALREHQPFLSAMLKGAPQTNEVGRAGPLMAGLLVIADRTKLPLTLLELGASAGLNLNLDRFAHRLGDLTTGDPQSPVRLSPVWIGPSPPDAEIKIVGRRGVDMAPLSALDPVHRSLLTAYVWPDQSDRLARIEGALGIAQAHPVSVDQGDAADWLDLVLPLEGPDGVTRVVFNTVAFQYFSPESQARIIARMDKAGAAASESAPLAWLRYEQDPGLQRTVLTLTLWPEGHATVLGLGHPHGSRLDFGYPGSL